MRMIKRYHYHEDNGDKRITIMKIMMIKSHYEDHHDKKDHHHEENHDQKDRNHDENHDKKDHHH